MRLVFLIAFSAFLIDQGIKTLILHVVDLDRIGSMNVLSPYLNLTMAWNYGINFGLLAQDSPLTRWMLISVALIISGAVLWWVWRDPSGRWQKIAAGLLVGGAMGNVADRLIYGAVVDFINLDCCGINNPYAFNTADVAVFAGAFGMVVFTTEKKPS